MNAICPICRATLCTPIYAADDQPVLLNALAPSREAALAEPRTSLRFVACESCGFVFNTNFDAKVTRYGAGYVNDQSFSPRFTSHLDRTADSLAAAATRSGPGPIIEIGCGQGNFLRDVCARARRRGIGFDPACTTCDDDPASGMRVERCVFDESQRMALTSEPPPSLVICRHVMEHLPDPLRMLRLIRRTMRTGGGTMYVEVPGFSWIAEHGAYFDLFNEHCSLFGERSVLGALAGSGFGGVRVERVFGGQYLAVLGGVGGAVGTGADTHTDAHTDAHTHSHKHADADADTRTLARELDDVRTRTVERVRALAGRRPAVVWGAGAKGVSFVAQLAADAPLVSHLVDINPAKQGRYVPVTGHPVIAPEALRGEPSEEPIPVILMNPNYGAEVSEHLRSLGITAELFDISRLRRTVPTARYAGV